MQAPIIEAVGLGSGGTGNITITLPTHSANHILLLFVESAGGEAVGAPSGGWQAVGSSPQSTGAGTAGTSLSVFWLRASGSGTTNPTITDPGNHVYGFAMVVSGCVTTGTPYTVTAGSVKASASTSTAIPGVTTGGNDRLVIYAATRDNDASGVHWSGQSNGNLSSLTNWFDDGTTQGNGGGIGLWSGVLNTAGPSGTLTATVSASVVHAYLCFDLADGAYATEAVTLDDVGQGEVTLIDHNGLKLADGPPSAQLVTIGSSLSATPTGEALKVADSVTAQRIWEVTIAESLKVVDSGRGLTQLIGTIRISDTVTVQLGTTLAATPSESLKIAESLTPTLNPLEPALSTESLKLADSASMAVGLFATPSEALRLADGTPTGQLNPIQISTGEALSVVDAVTAARGLTTTLSEDLKIADALTSTILIQANPSESLKIADTLTTRLNPLSAGPSESVRVSDDLSTTASLLVNVSELLNLSDRVQILQASVNEQMLLSDAGRGATQMLGVIKITDTAVAALSGVLGLTPTPSESIRLVEELTVVRTPLEANLQEVPRLGDTDGSVVELVRDEWLALTDTLVAAMGPATDLFVAFTDTVSLSEQLTARRTLSVVVTAEALALTDSASATRTLEVTVTADALKLADTATADPDREASVSESLKVVEATLLRELDPLELVVDPSTMRLSDPVTPNLGSPDDLSVLVLAEAVRVGESLSASSGLDVEVSEALTLVDAFQVEAAVDTEAIRIGDAVTAQVNQLYAELDGENIGHADTVTGTLAIAKTVQNEFARVNDSDLLVGMDLAAPDPGGGNDLVVALSEQIHLSDGAKASFYRVTFQLRGTTVPVVYIIGTSEG